MNMKSRIAKQLLLLVAFGMIITSCKKLGRPALGDYPTDDQQLPPGELRFYTSFDANSPEFRYQVADSISQNPTFFTSNPLTIAPGIRGNAISGKDGTAMLYLNANDFKAATSFTISFWEKNDVPENGKAEFIFSLPNKDYWHNSGMFLMFDHPGQGTTASEAVVKFAVQDRWFEFTNATGKMKGNLLNGQWHHMAIVYNETNSKITWYVDGAALTGLPAAVTDWTDDPGGANTPHGPMNQAQESVSRFVLGGWNKHVGLPGEGADWVQSWQGSLDQFRLYNKALSAAEVKALYDGRQ
jgi:hypothetical protein